MRSRLMLLLLMAVFQQSCGRAWSTISGEACRVGAESEGEEARGGCVPSYGAGCLYSSSQRLALSFNSGQRDARKMSWEALRRFASKAESCNPALHRWKLPGRSGPLSCLRLVNYFVEPKARSRYLENRAVIWRAFSLEMSVI